MSRMNISNIILLLLLALYNQLWFHIKCYKPIINGLISYRREEKESYADLYTIWIKLNAIFFLSLVLLFYRYIFVLIFQLIGKFIF